MDGHPPRPKVPIPDDLLEVSVEQIPDGVLVVDQEGRHCDYANAALCNLLGYAAGQLTKRPLADLIAPEDLPRLPGALHSLLAGDTLTEWRLRRRDRGFVPVEISATRLRDGRLLATVRDISRRLLDMKRLRISEERYRLIVENQSELIVRWLPDGTCIFANPSYLQAVGLTEVECLGSNIFEGTPDRGETCRGVVESLSSQSPKVVLDYRTVQAGTDRWHEWTNRGTFDEDGRLLSVISVGRDITDRQQIAERLRASQRHLLTSQRVAGLGSWESPIRVTGELDHSACRVTEEWLRIFGYPLDIPSVSFDSYVRKVHPDDRARVQECDERAAATRGRYAIDYRIVLDDGSERIVHEQAEVVPGWLPDEPWVMVGTTQDVTEARRLEQQLRHAGKIQAIGQLAGGVAHDFNNLLTVMNNNIELVLERGGLLEEDRDNLLTTFDAGRRAAQLVRQLLFFSRKATLNIAVLDMADVVSEIGVMLRRLIRENISMSCAIAPDLDRVRADKTQIEQVLVNLALNARDAMPGRGHLAIDVGNASFDAEYCRQHPDYLPGVFVRISVTDTGHGMTPDVRRHLFEPFFSTKEPGTGTGIGLATVHGIVRDNGGFIIVTSEVGVGSAFEVFLPAVSGAAATREPEPSPPMAAARGGTVLLVDDDPGIRVALQKSLEKSGYRVLAEGSGTSALDRSRAFQGAIDLLLADVVMEDMSGVELAERLVRERPGCAVLYMSGHAEDELPDWDPEATRDVFLQKPFTANELLAKLRDVLAGEVRTSAADGRGTVN